MFIKRKRDGTVKRRGVANGKLQRSWLTKKDASAPTVALPAFLITWMIDAHKGRYVITSDILGAFLQTTQPEDSEVILRFDGIMTEILAKHDPTIYCSKIIDHAGRKILYAKAEKAIYGTLNSTLLFWGKRFLLSFWPRFPPKPV